jgi:hypothetical protein
MRDIVEGIFQPPSRLRPEIPRGLEAVILRAMERVPDNRFANVRDLGLALIPFMSAKGRQQWSYHFTAPEAEMPVAPSTAVPTPFGAEARPAPTEIAPAQPPAPAVAPTKILPVGQPEPWQVVLTRTTPASVSLSAPAGPSLRRSHSVAVAVTIALVLLIALAAWVLRPWMVRDTERSAAPAAPTVERSAPPPAAPAAPVAPVPSAPEASPTRAAPARPADHSPKPAPRRPKKIPRSSVKFTPEGVPII